ncbi:MAG: glycosyltransferase family 2 protein [Armatimonadota bacterium]|nr:glycosyltransferase family 2 protein [bacterium]
MRLSIIIVNWNTTGLLKTLLKSIETHAPACDCEVIVVDNASDGFDGNSLKSEFPSVQLIANSANYGYARGNNQALALAQGDYVLLLNPDTEVTEGAIDALVAFMDSHPDAAAAGSKLVRPDGTIDRSVRSFPYPGPIAWEYMGLSRLFPKSRTLGAYRMTYFKYDCVAEVDQPMGSCLILGRAALNEVGILDERFPIFFNEVDWLYRAYKIGYKIYFTPDATIIHHGGAGTGQIDKRKMRRESHESLLRFYNKHFRGKIPAPVYWLVVACIRVNMSIRG